ncbi:hypothetical protein BDR03DRAFT_1004381 [Suillus americanus]|nr:hypothetical protein BDR03DRAFT_1004381 [Suillus americanus]
MSTVFGNWEPLAKAIRIIMFRKNSLEIVGWPRAKCNTQKWGITSSTPDLLAWGWVALIFIMSPDTSFTKDGINTKYRLPYVSMFTAYKQLWSSSSSNIMTPEAEDEDFTSDLMRLALTLRLLMIITTLLQSPHLPTTAPTAPGSSVLTIPESTTPIVNASPVPTTPTITVTTGEALHTAQTNVTLVPNALNAISMALPAVPVPGPVSESLTANESPLV